MLELQAEMQSYAFPCYVKSFCLGPGTFDFRFKMRALSEKEELEELHQS